jgi:anti-anti-sigma regulatory factor
MSIHVQVRDQAARITMPSIFSFPLYRKFIGAYAPLLRDSGVHSIEIELSKIGHLDSSSLGMLMLLNERANVLSKSVILLNPSSIASQYFDVAGFSRFFMIRYQ